MSLIPYVLARPFLFSLDPETAHEWTLKTLSATQGTPLQLAYGARGSAYASLASSQGSQSWKCRTGCRWVVAGAIGEEIMILHLRQLYPVNLMWAC